MKIDLCCYSGRKIYPGHGRRIVKPDGKPTIFLNSKCERGVKLKRNPRDISWTILYRRKHRKGADAFMKQTKTKITQKFERAIVGMSLAEILAKRNERPEVRAARRDQAIRSVKQRNRARQQKKPAAVQKDKPATKETTKKKDATGEKKKPTKSYEKSAKPVKVKAPRIGGKR